MMKRLCIGFVMDPIASINPKKDTTLALMLEAQKRGYRIFTMQPHHLFLSEQGDVSAIMQETRVKDDIHQWFTLESSENKALSDLDVILMRKDPPVDAAYTIATHLLERAQREGTPVINDPRSLRDLNEKLFATDFPQFQPPTLITSSHDLIMAFAKKHGDIILKPLHGMGGTSVFHIRPEDANLKVIMETLTGDGTRSIVAQRFIPEIRDGDKRILMIKGEPYPYALARLPAKGEIRANLASGGRGIGQPLSERDHSICHTVGPALKSRGILFAGIDVIGDYLTEINITSPTCVRELEKQYHTNISGQILDAILE
ncbi:MAG: glutathione synthase [Gammaproteobacteria bacterium]|nr:MAG: glutathione synthase [Gammaproteobacteria bacterium]